MSEGKRPKVAVLGFYPAQFQELRKKVPHLELVHCKLHHGGEHGRVPADCDAVLVMEGFVGHGARRVAKVECARPVLRVSGSLSAAKRALCHRYPPPGTANLPTRPPVPLAEVGERLKDFVGRDRFERLFAHTPAEEVTVAPPAAATDLVKPEEKTTVGQPQQQQQVKANGQAPAQRGRAKRLTQTQFFRLTEELRNRVAWLEERRPTYAEACQEMSRAVGAEVCDKTLRQAMRLTGVTWVLPQVARKLAGAGKSSALLRRQVAANSDAIVLLFRQLGLPVPEPLAGVLGLTADAVAGEGVA